MKLRIASLPSLAVLTLVTLSTYVPLAHATTIPLPVTNGNFDGTGATQFGTGYATLPGWTTSGYNFVFTPGSGDTTGSQGQYGNVSLWGPANGGAMSNYLPAASPLGGNYVAADGAFQVDAIRQTINNLIVGQQYSLGFYFAGAQQYGFTGPTTEQWIVSLGSETYATPILQNANHGFTGWQYQNMTFTATSVSETLSFLAVGTPSGEPPFSLLDGVNIAPVSPVPEPGTFALLFTGLAGVGGVVRNRFKK